MEYQTISQPGTLGLVQNKVLRNTYMMLALTMIPTIIGAFVGLSTNFSFMAQDPIMAPLLMFGVMMGMLFAVTALRNSVWGIAMLLGFTFVAGCVPRANPASGTAPEQWRTTGWHGCWRHRPDFLQLGNHRYRDQKRFQLHGQVSVHRADPADRRLAGQYILCHSGSVADHLRHRRADLLGLHPV